MIFLLFSNWVSAFNTKLKLTIAVIKIKFESMNKVYDQLNMLTKRLSQSAAQAANKPERHKTAFRAFMIQIWSCMVKVLKPVPVVAEYKLLCFFKHAETQPRRHSERQTLTVKTFSGCPRALMLVSWICLRIIQASSCFPTWQEGRQVKKGRRDKFMGSAPVSLTQGQWQCRIRNRAYCT